MFIARGRFCFSLVFWVQSFIFWTILSVEMLAQLAEVQPHLSPDLIKIMEQRLSAIENRSAFLQNLMNQVTMWSLCFFMSSFHT